MLSRTENATLMIQARQSLSGNWPIACGVAALEIIVNLGLDCLPLPSWVLLLMVWFLVGGPLAVGVATFFLRLQREGRCQFMDLFCCFRSLERVAVVFHAALLSALLISIGFLWLIVPGIILSIAFSMLWFVLADDPAITVSQALRKTWSLMQGNLWKYFCLNCRFIGWFVLCALTFGIGLLWLQPYFLSTAARFYLDIIDGPDSSRWPPIAQGCFVTH